MTAQQRKLLAFIRERADEGECPSLSEMAAALGLASKGRIGTLLDALEERGHITRLRHRVRAIQVIHDICPHCGRELRQETHAPANTLIRSPKSRRP